MKKPIELRRFELEVAQANLVAAFASYYGVPDEEFASKVDAAVKKIAFDFEAYDEIGPCGLNCPELDKSTLH
jgi:hypothetical protein